MGNSHLTYDKKGLFHYPRQFVDIPMRPYQERYYIISGKNNHQIVLYTENVIRPRYYEDMAIIIDEITEIKEYNRFR